MTVQRIARYAANAVIAGVWLWAFHNLGWITFSAETDKILLEQVVTAAMISLVVEFISDWIYGLSIILTCGVGCLFYIPYVIAQGWIYIVLTSSVTRFFEVNVEFFWTGLLMSLAFGLVKIHRPSEPQSPNAGSTKSSDTLTVSF